MYVRKRRKEAQLEGSTVDYIRSKQKLENWLFVLFMFIFCISCLLILTCNVCFSSFFHPLLRRFSISLDHSTSSSPLRRQFFQSLRYLLLLVRKKKKIIKNPFFLNYVYFLKMFLKQFSVDLSELNYSCVLVFPRKINL